MPAAMNNTSARSIIENRNAKARDSWGERHRKAFALDTTGIAGMLRSWAKYADDYNRRFGSTDTEEGYSLSDDYVLGEAWKDVGRGIRTMLNGDLAGMDGGTLDGMIVDIFAANGIPDTEI